MIKIGEILSWISERTVPPSSPSLENKIITQKNGKERQLHCRKGCFYADTIKLDEFSPVHIKHSLLMTTPSCRTCSLSSSRSAGTVLGRSQVSPSIIFFFLLIYSPCRKNENTIDYIEFFLLNMQCIWMKQYSASLNLIWRFPQLLCQAFTFSQDGLLSQVVKFIHYSLIYLFF